MASLSILMATSATASPTTIAPGIVAVTGLMLILGVLFVAGRLFSNITMTRKVQIDDYACIIATILSFTHTGLSLAINHHAQYQSKLPLDRMDGFFLKTIYAAETIAGPAAFFAKSSVLLILLRIFSSPNKTLRHFIYAGFVMAFTIQWINVPLYTYFCASHDGLWNSNVSYKCDSLNISGVIQAPLNILLNLYILVLPIPSIMRLNLSLKKRLGIVFILMHGVFALIASIITLHYRISLFSSPQDSLWYRTAILITTNVENSMTIVCSSMHACYSYLRRYNARKISQYNSGNSYGTVRSSSLAQKSRKMSVPTTHGIESLVAMTSREEEVPSIRGSRGDVESFDTAERGVEMEGMRHMHAR